MKVFEKVLSRISPKEVEFDAYHVYVNKDITQIKDPQTSEIQYQYTVNEYDRDEFLTTLSSGQLSLSGRASDLENMILEMSIVVYS